MWQRLGRSTRVAFALQRSQGSMSGSPSVNAEGKVGKPPDLRLTLPTESLGNSLNLDSSFNSYSSRASLRRGSESPRIQRPPEGLSQGQKTPPASPRSKDKPPGSPRSTTTSRSPRPNSPARSPPLPPEGGATDLLGEEDSRLTDMERQAVTPLQLPPVYLTPGGTPPVKREWDIFERTRRRRKPLTPQQWEELKSCRYLRPPKSAPVRAGLHGNPANGSL